MAMAYGSFASRVVATRVVALDGTGDFTDIQSAVDDLPSGGGVVYIKEGTYTLSDSVEITKGGITIRGTGYATIISGNFNKPIIKLDTANYAVIEGLQIVGNVSAGASNDGIYTGGSRYIYVLNCWIHDCGANGINSSGLSRYNIFSNNRVYDNVGIGLIMTSLYEIASGNQIYYNGSYGIYMDGSQQSKVEGNMSRYNDNHGIYASSCGSCIINDNHVSYNGFGGDDTVDGIHLNSCSNMIVSGNRCYNNDRYEININDAGCIRAFVHGNHAYGTVHVGAINDSGTGSTVSDNVIA